MQQAVGHRFRSHKRSETAINTIINRHCCHRPTDEAVRRSSPTIINRHSCHRPTDAQAIGNNNQQWFGLRHPLVPQADCCSWPSYIATDRASDQKQQSTMVRMDAAAGATGRPMQQAINHRHRSHKQPSHDSMDDRSEASTIALM
jgi:hypothetical protein